MLVLGSVVMHRSAWWLSDLTAAVCIAAKGQSGAPCFVGRAEHAKSDRRYREQRNEWKQIDRRCSRESQVSSRMPRQAHDRAFRQTDLYCTVRHGSQLEPIQFARPPSHFKRQKKMFSDEKSAKRHQHLASPNSCTLDCFQRRDMLLLPSCASCDAILKLRYSEVRQVREMHYTHEVHQAGREGPPFFVEFSCAARACRAPTPQVFCRQRFAIWVCFYFMRVS